MILYIGGRYQGKLEAALSRINASESEVLDLSKIKSVDDFRKLETINFNNVKIIYKVEELVRFAVMNETAVRPLIGNSDSNFKALVKEYILKLVNINKIEAIIVSEVGAGVVPVDRRENDFREITGEIASELAKCSESVIRIVCGIEQKIK